MKWDKNKEKSSKNIVMGLRIEPISFPSSLLPFISSSLPPSLLTSFLLFSVKERKEENKKGFGVYA